MKGFSGATLFLIGLTAVASSEDPPVTNALSVMGVSGTSLENGNPSVDAADSTARPSTPIIAGASIGAIGLLGAGSWFAYKSLNREKDSAGEESSFEQVDKEKMMEIDIDEFLR